MRAETQRALAIARKLAEHGMPIFLARPATKQDGEWDPDGASGLGYYLPKQWQQTTADPSVLDHYADGMAIGAVCGHTLDVLDTDPRNGGDEGAAELGEVWPTTYGRASTPSGGTHDFIAALGVAKCKAAHGVDLQAGAATGSGRGFVFIAPTEKRSKTDGQIRAYTWIEPPDFDRIATEAADDHSGRPLIARLGDAAKPARQTRTRKRGNASDRFKLEAIFDGVPAGGRDDAAFKYASSLRSRNVAKPEAQVLMRQAWSRMEQPAKDEYPLDAATEKVDRVYETYPEGKTGTRQSLNDSPLAEWVKSELGDRLNWSGGLSWMKYDGRVWKPVTNETVIEDVRKLFNKLFKQEVASADSDRVKQLAQLRQGSKIRAVVSLLRGMVEVDAADFDQQRDLLNCRNGVVDFRTGDLRPHDPALLLTKIAKVEYLPDAHSPDWDQALQALPDEVAGWMQLRFGQAASGHPPPDDILAVLQGTGANGKTTLVSGIVTALGDHATVVPERVLLANPSDHPTELTTLRGVRLALIEETPEARHLSVKRLKDLVGTERITARKIRQDNIEWVATHTLFLTSNYRPRVDETDHGTWRRLALVRFPYTFRKPGEQARSDSDRPGDPELRDRIRQGEQKQHEAILAWVVAGALRYYQSGRRLPQAPEQVTQDTDTWRAEADLVFAFVSETLDFDPDAKVLSTELFEVFGAWHRNRGHITRPWTDQTFTARFGDHETAQRHNVQKTRTKNLDGLSRPDWARTKTRPREATVWLGVRFRPLRTTQATPDPDATQDGLL